MAKVLYLRAENDEAALAAIRAAFPTARMHTSTQSWAFIRSGLHIRLLAGSASDVFVDDAGPWRRIEVRGCAQHHEGPWDGYVQAAFDVADRLASPWGAGQAVRFDPVDALLTAAADTRAHLPTVCPDHPTGWRPHFPDRALKRRHRGTAWCDGLTRLRVGR